MLDGTNGVHRDSTMRWADPEILESGPAGEASVTDAVVAADRPEEPSSEPAAETVTFATGASRSMDGEKYAYDLISPIGLDSIAYTAGRPTPQNDAIDATDDPMVLVSMAWSHVADFLHGGDSDNPLPEWVDSLGYAALAVFRAIHLERGGEANFMEWRDTPRSKITDAPALPRYDLIAPRGLDGLAETYKEGATKRGTHNWERGFTVASMLNRTLRHFKFYFDGDVEEPHLPHAAWGIVGAIHSLYLWPDLNRRTLRSSGCVGIACDDWGVLKAGPMTPAPLERQLFFKGMEPTLQANSL